ncbi:hypothetical protein C9374_012391 [Naegleria lovaniensis]|uniref:Serine aminopeptidase S33 domain-containing protein n=1 Tax=Naegleria lovaniensis TaxID=51637 RepID=A0AA88KQV1_NAELO|nr:uncharacterized protein C9374_012391 [Naegleria lovaniensis]KAG2392139.1 hypothetical protein C9374_012391 [Naegleria lovaniensis]
MSVQDLATTSLPSQLLSQLNQPQPLSRLRPVPAHELRDFSFPWLPMGCKQYDSFQWLRKRKRPLLFSFHQPLLHSDELLLQEEFVQISSSSSIENNHHQHDDEKIPTTVQSENSPFSFFSMFYDEIEGAKIALAIPDLEGWNGGVLIHCHGHRAKGIPLQADLTEENMPHAFRELLREGWIIAMTSYRREGIVLRDAIQDVNNLREYIERKCGHVECCILEGRSMGGAIVTFLSEKYGEWYDGAVCIGAALRVDQRNEELPHLMFTYRPKFPILYLTNVSELGEPSNYIEKVKQLSESEAKTHKGLPNDEIIVPALWTVYREGHNLVSELERFSAISSLIQWIKYQSNVTMKTNESCTQPAQIPPSQVEFCSSQSHAQGAWGKVKQLFIYGSFSINFTSQDFEKLGIVEGKYFTFHVLTKQYGMKTVSASFGSFPFIKQATDLEWVAFVSPVDNYIVLHVNTYSFSNEASKLGIAAGDSVFVEQFKTLPPRRSR